MRLSDIAPIALRVGHIKEQLLTPCGCGRLNCTLGEHVWHATRAMTNGPRATSTDPSTHGWRYEEVTYNDGVSELLPVATGDSVGETAINGSDPNGGAHDEYRRRLSALHRATDDLALFLGAHRPDRTLPKMAGANDDEFCRHHLATIGKCVPRDSGDLCDFCRTYQVQTRKLPPEALLSARHEGRNKDVARLLTKSQLKPKRRKARK